MKFAFYLFFLLYFDAFGITLFRLGLGGMISPILSLGGLSAIGLILYSPRCMTLVKRCWPLLILCGLALLSTLWSVDPGETANRALQLTFGMLLVISLVGTFGCTEALRLIIRVMSLICVLSLIWAVFFPTMGVHQATDVAQTVHAGLWRGVFSHKISLGTFAAVTLSLLLFYGRRSFSNLMFCYISLGSAAVCILMSGSATAVLAAVVMVTLLFASHHVARHGPSARRPILRIVAVSLCLIVAAMFSGMLDGFVVLLGRSDLTGRTEYWPFVLDFIHAEGRLLGYGYDQFPYVGEAIKWEAGMLLGEAHNGFLEMVVDFGYPGALIVALVHFYLLWQMARQLTVAPGYTTRIAVFPFSLIATLLVSSYAESIILEYRGMWTLLLAMAVSIHVTLVAAQRQEAQIADVAMASTGLEQAPPR